ncbi:hypothetical protein B0H66DRAFT_629404 [Apodospora peruviana]|uniref:Uncharacterized protein n=1 Tax=Apodospora peruviana TaxID=516989 RepID=A0AAE0LZK5_9PEZI|nr:hypothetical protein B0H66DRAFT_629404 [Apodospora peruviana]
MSEGIASLLGELAQSLGFPQPTSSQTTSGTNSNTANGEDRRDRGHTSRGSDTNKSGSTTSLSAGYPAGVQPPQSEPTSVTSPNNGPTDDSNDDDDDDDDDNDMSTAIRRHMRKPKELHPKVSTMPERDDLSRILSTRSAASEQNIQRFIVRDFLTPVKRHNAPKPVSSTPNTQDKSPIAEVTCSSTASRDVPSSLGKRAFLTVDSITALGDRSLSLLSRYHDKKRRKIDRHRHSHRSNQHVHSLRHASPALRLGKQLEIPPFRHNKEVRKSTAEENILRSSLRLPQASSQPHLSEKRVTFENIKAIKNTPTTAGPKAIVHIEKLKQTEAQKKDKALFRALEAKLPQKKQATIVNGLSDGLPQREAFSHRSSKMPGPEPETRARTNPPAHLPIPTSSEARLLAIKNSTPSSRTDRPPGQKPAPSKPKPLPEYSKLTPSPQPQAATSVPVPAAAAPPRKSAPAVDLLGEDRPTLQWVVYRTKRFNPTPTLPSGQQRMEEKIRCTAHASKKAANEAAEARHNRVHKDVIRNLWSLEGKKGFYDGVLEFADKNVQYYWVEEEQTDLSKMADKWRADTGRIKGAQGVAGGEEMRKNAVTFDCEEEEENDDNGLGLLERREMIIQQRPWDGNPFSLIRPPETQHHGSYTTAADANEHALSVFIHLAKPRNARIEDNHYYKHHIEPDMRKLFEADNAKDPDEPVTICWEVAVEGCKWDFLYLEVKVVESELQGVIDVTDMVVDGGPCEPVHNEGNQDQSGHRFTCPVENGDDDDDDDMSEEE